LQDSGAEEPSVPSYWIFLLLKFLVDGSPCWYCCQLKNKYITLRQESMYGRKKCGINKCELYL